jgi:cytochrome c
MRKMTMLAVALGTMGSLALSGSALAADGASLYSQKGCIACHGPKGDKPITPAYPKLAGQQAKYMVDQMKDIKSGARNNGQAAAMRPIVSGVSEADMQTIADWLSKQ